MIDLFQLSIIAILIFSFLIVFYIKILPNLMEIRDIPQMLEDFLSNETLPDLMQGATGAILGILLAFYVGIILERLTGNTLQNNHLQKLDISVIMDHVYPFPKALIIIATSLILPMGMVISSVYWQLPLFIIWAGTVIYIIRGIQKIYHWIKGEKNDYRIQYLDSIKRHTNTEHWDNVWKNENLYNYNIYLNTFQDTINTILNRQEKQELEKLPSLLNSFLGNNQDIHRISYFIYNNQFMNNLFLWHNQLWRKKETEKYNESIILSYKSTIYIIHMILKQTITHKSDLQSLFIVIDEALQDLKDDYIVDNKRKKHYFGYLGSIFYFIIEYGKDNPHPNNILWVDQMPEEWKVTEENWKTNRISQLLISKFLQFTRDYYRDYEDIDSYIEHIINRLFPEIDNQMWSRIIHLHVKNSIVDIVQNSPKFIWSQFDIANITIGEGPEDEYLAQEQQKQFDNTINLAQLIFGKTLFTDFSIQRWIDELYEYTPSNKTEEKEKTMWLNFLTKMQDKVSNHYE